MVLGNFCVLGVAGDAHPEDFWVGYLVEWKASGFFTSFILCDAAQMWLLRGHCQGMLSAEHSSLPGSRNWPFECPGGRCGETQGSCTSLIDGLDPCQGNVGQRNRNGPWQQLQKVFKLHLCAVAGVISGSVSYLLLLLWNHRVRQGQVFLNCLLGFWFLPESLLSCSLN